MMDDVAYPSCNSQATLLEDQQSLGLVCWDVASGRLAIRLIGWQSSQSFEFMIGLVHVIQFSFLGFLPDEG